MKPIECKAILFDLDGTLVDSGSCIEQLWSGWAEKNHLDVSYVLSIIHGRTIEETLRLISPYFDNQQCVDEIKDLAIKALSQVKAINGAIDFVKKLPLDRWAVVTSGAKRVSLQSITNSGIPIPNLMITAEDITHGKPDPEPYLTAASKLGVAPSDCLVFEDADSGVRSALVAGMRVILIGENNHTLLRDGMIKLKNYQNIKVVLKPNSIALSW